MQAEAQKLELITWIAAIDDNGVLEKLYAVKKALEPKRLSRKKARTTEVPKEAIDLLDKITSAYAKANEPDLNLAQLFTDRTKTDGRNLDFN